MKLQGLAQQVWSPQGQQSGRKDHKQAGTPKNTQISAQLNSKEKVSMHTLWNGCSFFSILQLSEDNLSSSPPYQETYWKEMSKAYSLVQRS